MCAKIQLFIEEHSTFIHKKYIFKNKLLTLYAVILGKKK